MTPQEFGKRFFDFSSTAFRMETRDGYAVSSEREALARFAAGEPYGLEWLAGWLGKVADARAAGKVIRRVRVVSLPLGDYDRFGLDVSRHAVRAGEDIRYLARVDAYALGLPGGDAWLFDDVRLAVLDFAADGTLREVREVTDPAETRRRRELNELAWRHAVPAASFAPGDEGGEADV